MISFSPKQKAFLKQPFKHTLEVNEGTPRSGKTTAGVFRYAANLIRSEDTNHLVTAYNQEQAYRLVLESDGLGLKHIFDGVCQLKHDDNGDHLEIITPKGLRRVYYKGGGKADSHKSITGMSLGSVYFAEINLLHLEMVQECLRRTYAARQRYHLADLNPPSPNHPLIRQVFDIQDTDWLHWTIDDNPVITAERKAELYRTLSQNPYLFKRDWLGERTIPEGVIYAMFDLEQHQQAQLSAGQEIREMFLVADGGQTDATSCSCNLVLADRQAGCYKLARAAHYYHSGKDSGQVKAMSIYAKELLAFIGDCVRRFGRKASAVYVDPACKSLREELHLLGVQTKAANNNSREKVGAARGIEVGIERAQNLLSDGRFFLLENPQHGHYDFIKEIGLYCRDQHGKPIDAYNHAMDEFRYSVNTFYKHYVKR